MANIGCIAIIKKDQVSVLVHVLWRFGNDTGIEILFAIGGIRVDIDGYNSSAHLQFDCCRPIVSDVFQPQLLIKS